jgi:SIR2-like protein
MMPTPPTSAAAGTDVVYLFGAGASHANAKLHGSAHGTLMADLKPAIDALVQELARRPPFRDHPSIDYLANEVITDEKIDIEQIITFLDESRSEIHRRFADGLRKIFAKVLREKLAAIEKELKKTPTDLYSAVLDMHEVPGFSERLRGILTLNYDVFLERAIERDMGCHVDFGISVNPPTVAGRAVKVLKLHGSFGWTDEWPIQRASKQKRLWIPPGIQKEKRSYPFNALWGMARELLECDVLRIVGCNLGKNDWDLVSLLFTTQHAHRRKRPYQVEIINRPSNAEDVKRQFPQLNAKSLLEIDVIGDQIVGEISGGPPRPFNDFVDEERSELIERASKHPNPFLYWLKQKAEEIFRMRGSLDTGRNALKRILEEY